MFFFDEHWYTTRADVAEQVNRSGLRPEEHYHRIGAKSGLSPNRYFDESWYLRTYRDVRRAVAAAEFQSGFHHYMLRGASEGRSPNPDFDEKWYLTHYPDVAQAVRRGDFRCGYEHYLSSGELEGRSPNRRVKSATTAAGPTYHPVLTRIPHIVPAHVSVQPALARKPRLNVALPSLQMQYMSGGPNTVLNLAYRLAAEGIPVRLMSFNTPLDDTPAPLQTHLQSLTGISQWLPSVEITTAAVPDHPAAIGENDIFMASAWWTAQMISAILPSMRKKRYWYVIQDFEPGLHEWGSQYAMALETYSHDMLPIVNTSLLKDYFIANNIGRFSDPAVAEDLLVFEPAVDDAFFAPEPRHPARPLRLLFYARPTNAKRNLFEIGLAALGIAASEGAFRKVPWDLLYIGEQLPETQLPGGQTIRCAPWLRYEGYAHLIRQSDVLLSLMLSPHPSYPPLEMARSGGLVVTNVYECKTQERLSFYSPNLIAADPFPVPVAGAIHRAVELAEKRPQRLPPAKSKIPSSWDTSLRPVLSALRKMWETEQHSCSSAA
jgi:hypothetical protein